MNIFEAMKQLKNMKEVMEEVKKELRSEREVLSKDGVKVTFNGLGEVIDIEFPPDSRCGELKDTLVELLNQAQEISRDKMKEAFNRKMGGILGGFGFGL